MHTDIFSQRRADLRQLCDKPYPIVIHAPRAVQATHDIAYTYAPDATFYWLTGVTEPGWVLVITDTGEGVLVAPEQSDVEALFEGDSDVDLIQKVSGVDRVVSSSKRGEYFEELSGLSSGAYILGDDPYDAGDSVAANPSNSLIAVENAQLFDALDDIRPTINKLRSIKSESEQVAMRTAITATVDSFVEVKRRLPDLANEYEVEAEFTYAFRKQNMRHAYEPIVAGGVNALTLHYTRNDQPLPKNGLILLDIGAATNGYAADITRTYAIGTPTDREVAVHAAVESAQQAIIALIQPGVSFKEYHDRSDDIMKDALRGLGLFNEPSDFRKYFPHAVSHGLGIDVHESLGGYKEFQPGMVLTVEPGIYIPEEGIGVRIEDDILVTEDGNENLSAALPTSL